jgi:hypothetical protein
LALEKRDGFAFGQRQEREEILHRGSQAGKGSKDIKHGKLHPKSLTVVFWLISNTPYMYAGAPVDVTETADPPPACRSPDRGGGRPPRSGVVRISARARPLLAGY